jgi:hypothetical protein
MLRCKMMRWSGVMTAGKFVQASVAAVSVPWNAFVGAFLYFTLVTAAVIGGADFSRLVMAVVYLLPVSLYAAVLVSRALHALSAITIDIDHAPHAVIR